MAYRTMIGLEIHLELLTDTKMYCGCKNDFGGEANSHCCPICLGLPGAKPSLNKRAVELAIKAGLALDCDIQAISEIDRKHYFYLDLTKGYQISQGDNPICLNGYVEIKSDSGFKKVRLERIQLEEDTGKLIHNEDDTSYVDFNRAGVPLAEIVTLPDMNSASEAREFLENLRDRLKYIGVSDGKMEQGSLRCDVNINVIDEENNRKSVISEIKNINSFRAVEKAIEYEEKRHIELLEKGENTKRETRRWDDENSRTVFMREKGGDKDYRFVNDPQFGDIIIEEEMIEEIRSRIPELPHVKFHRFIEEYGLTEYDSKVLTADKDIADFFEAVNREINDSNLVSNWVMGDVLRRLNDDEISMGESSLKPEDLVTIIRLVKEGEISNNLAKKVLRKVFESGKSPEEIVEEEGLSQISDKGELEAMVDKILEENPQSIEDYKAGKDRALGFLVGQVMKISKGQANPQVVNKILRERLGQL